MGQEATYCPKCGKAGATVEVVVVNPEISQIVTNCGKCGTRYEWAKFRPSHAHEDLSLRPCPVCGNPSAVVRQAETDALLAVEYKCPRCGFRVVVARKK